MDASEDSLHKKKWNKKFVKKNVIVKVKNWLDNGDHTDILVTSCDIIIIIIIITSFFKK